MVEGLMVSYDAINDRVIDVVTDQAEKYFKKFEKPALIAQVPQFVSDEEINSIIKSGVVDTVLRKFTISWVLVGQESSPSNLVKERLSDSKEQATG